MASTSCTHWEALPTRPITRKVPAVERELTRITPMRWALPLSRRQLQYPIVATVDDIDVVAGIDRQPTRAVKAGKWQNPLRPASGRQLHHVTEKGISDIHVASSVDCQPTGVDEVWGQLERQRTLGPRCRCQLHHPMFELLDDIDVASRAMSGFANIVAEAEPCDAMVTASMPVPAFATC